MAIVRQIGELLYIQWYDALAKKVQTQSTGLPANKANIKKAELQAKELQDELTRKRKTFKRLGIQRVTIDDAFKHFLRNNQHKNPKTIKDYERFQKRFNESFPPEMPSTSINKLNVENWLIQLKQTNYAQNTVHGFGKQLNHFLNFLFEYNYTTMFRINREVKTKPEIKEKIILTDEDITKAFKQLKNKNSNFVTTIYLLFYTGLRSSDVMTITREKIDLENRIINYYSPKRKKFREIAFHQDLVPILQKRMKEIPQGPLLNYNCIENLGRAITRYFKDELKFKKPYTARTFRKTFITLCRSRYNMDASVVRELVGHEHGNTTDRYYNEISVDRMREELNKFVRPTYIKKKKEGS